MDEELREVSRKILEKSIKGGNVTEEFLITIIAQCITSDVQNEKYLVEINELKATIEEMKNKQNEQKDESYDVLNPDDILALKENPFIKSPMYTTTYCNYACYVDIKYKDGKMVDCFKPYNFKASITDIMSVDKRQILKKLTDDIYVFCATTVHSLGIYTLDVHTCKIKSEDELLHVCRISISLEIISDKTVDHGWCSSHLTTIINETIHSNDRVDDEMRKRGISMSCIAL